MTKTPIVSAVSPLASAATTEAARRTDAPLARREDAAAGPRLLADWELVLVGGGETTPNW